MFRVVSLLPPILLAALLSECTTTEPNNSTGKTFFIVFPENIAYYHPSPPKNQIHITAFYDDTSVEIKQHTYHTTTKFFQAGQSRSFILDRRLELGKAEISDKVLEITSKKDIVVQAISFRNYSMQTALVIPTEKLGQKYLIPPIPIIQGSTYPASVVTELVTERGPFKLIIVNGNQKNKVTFKGDDSKEVTLQPKHVAQIWLQENNALRVVEAEQPVAVLFGHPCAIHNECTCSLLYTMLSPAKDKKLKFFVPSVFPWKSEDATKILLSETGSAKIEAINPNSSMIEVAGTAILYRPRFLLNLIPETDFACCYVVTPIPDMENYAVIVVHKDKTKGVHVGSDPLEDSEWKELKGTDYVSTKISLPLTSASSMSTSIIWHTSSKMAVYFLGQDSKVMFANPAATISKSPDFRGCVLIPEVIEIGDSAEGWRESLKYCQDKEMELLCFAEAKVQTQTSKRLSEINNGSLQEVWIGMRRSSLNGQWYWVNMDPVSSTNWQRDEPFIESTHQCVVMDLKNDKDFGWRSENCCNAFHPVCYTKPAILKSWPIDNRSSP